MRNETIDPGRVDLRACDFSVRAIREDVREADFICSTDSIDRYGESVDQSSWQLEPYLANPCVLWAHDSRDLPIGQAKNVGVIDGKLQATVVFSKAHQRAEDVWRCVQERTLRGISVGFIPHTYRLEKRADVEVVVLADCELVELSVTPTPANSDCLARARAKALASTQQTSTAKSVVAEDTAMSDDKIRALEATILQRDAEVRASEKRATESETKVKALEAQNEHLVKERDVAIAAQKAAEKCLVERDVDALIGVKFTKEERDAQVELACANRPLFEKMLAQRGDLPSARDLTGKGLVIGADPAPAIRELGDAGEGLDGEIQKAMS